MTDSNIAALNKVTETLIDSYDGYQKCLDVAQDNPALRQQFLNRAEERAALINKIQSQVRSLGGEPKTDGSVLASAHRKFVDVASMFQSDEKAAINALDDGEEYLAERCESCLDENLSPQAQDLIRQAHVSAKAGERFADMMG